MFGSSDLRWFRMSVVNWRKIGGRSGEMEMLLPLRCLAFASHSFRSDRSVKRIMIPAPAEGERWWQALIRVPVAFWTWRVSAVSSRPAARVSCSVSLAGPSRTLPHSQGRTYGWHMTGNGSQSACHYGIDSTAGCRYGGLECIHLFRYRSEFNHGFVHFL